MFVHKISGMDNKSTNLSENDIRPDSLLEGQHAAVQKDIDFLMSRIDSFVLVSCPACGATETAPRFEKKGISYVTCLACATFFVNPRPSQAVLEEFYSTSANYAYWNTYIFPASEAARREKIFIPRVDRVLELCNRHGVSSGSLLEVGSGFGTFCEELMSRNVFERVVAIEPTPDLAETCRKRGIEVIESPIEKVSLDAQQHFDVIVSFEVIEHLFSPKEFVAECKRLLKPGGLLIITCPNGKGFDVEVLGTASDTVDHEHLNYFNPASMEVLLAREGLETVESITPGKLDAELVRKKVLSGDMNLDEQPFLKRVLIDEWETLGDLFQSFIVDNLLSSNMLVVARRT